jgi:hypothetical protein
MFWHLILGRHPRYERAAMRPSVNHVLKTLATRYGLKVEDLMKGKRGKQNEARKVGMYLVKEAMRSEVTGDCRTIWDGELWSGGLGLSSNQLQIGVRHEVAGTGGSNPAKLPTKDLPPRVTIAVNLVTPAIQDCRVVAKN